MVFIFAEVTHSPEYKVALICLLSAVALYLA